MKIRIDLSPASAERAAEQLRAYAQQLLTASDTISRRLSEEAAEEARQHYGPEVTVEALDHGVRASGEEVVFQEFGAGARISDPFPGGADIGVDIRRGSYSEMNEGEYFRSGYELWHHDGEEYRYVTPTNALFYGMMRAKDMAAEVAKEEVRKIK